MIKLLEIIDLIYYIKKLSFILTCNKFVYNFILALIFNIDLLLIFYFFISSLTMLNFIIPSFTISSSIIPSSTMPSLIISTLLVLNANTYYGILLLMLNALIKIVIY